MTRINVTSFWGRQAMRQWGRRRWSQCSVMHQPTQKIIRWCAIPTCGSPLAHADPPALALATDHRCRVPSAGGMPLPICSMTAIHAARAGEWLAEARAPKGQGRQRRDHTERDHTTDSEAKRVFLGGIVAERPNRSHPSPR